MDKKSVCLLSWFPEDNPLAWDSGEEWDGEDLHREEEEGEEGHLLQGIIPGEVLIEDPGPDLPEEGGGLRQDLDDFSVTSLDMHHFDFLTSV